MEGRSTEHVTFFEVDRFFNRVENQFGFVCASEEARPEEDVALGYVVSRVTTGLVSDEIANHTIALCVVFDLECGEEDVLVVAVAIVERDTTLD